MTVEALERRLIKACLDLSHICVEEARWVVAPQMKAAMVRHAIEFLDAARNLLPLES